MIQLVNQNGVELTSWKIDKYEIIYQKNGSWSKQDPFLFPNIGNSPQNWNLKQNLISMPKHGIFVNKLQMFTKDQDKYIYKQETHKNYPYKFSITKMYNESNNTLKITSEIKNLDSEILPYQIGYHLALKIDDDSKIIFGKDEYIINLVDLKKGTVLEETKIFKTKQIWKIDFEMFKNYDSLIFANNQLKNLTLVTKEYELEFSFSDLFKVITLWTNSSSNDENKFICIEPWSNIPTTIQNFNQSKLEPMHKREFWYQIKYQKVS